MQPRLHRRLPHAAFILLASLLALKLLLDHRFEVLPSLQGFSRRPEFSLLDSLPALSPGMSELEAFKFTADASSKTNADRSIWLDDSIGAFGMEYYTGKAHHDSTMFYLWTSDSLVASRTLADARILAWKIPYARRVDDWTEVVGAYVSRPRFLKFKATDAAVTPFEGIEGKTLHVVRRRYRDRGERPLAADTAYPAGVTGEIQLLARGDALALVNPSSRTVRVRVIRLKEGRWDLCEAEARTTRIYRSLLRGRTGPVLAYTSAGDAHLLRLGEAAPVSYFWLDAR